MARRGRHGGPERRVRAHRGSHGNDGYIVIRFFDYAQGVAALIYGSVRLALHPPDARPGRIERRGVAAEEVLRPRLDATADLPAQGSRARP
jgi:hypothetical protein